ncbi:hypothetical protein JW698_00260 [Candidatus Wolfebacteria bacterium]|nr:hypothetical protein [Candidatus Wolfebacteria bacterium]
MNEETQQNQEVEPFILQTIPPKKPKSKFLKFSGVFLLIIALSLGSFLVWNKYFSNEAKSNRETIKNYEKYTKAMENLEKIMTEDTYGGKTPEETLRMFINALENEDLELASKYFILETNENSEYYLTREEYEDALNKVKNENRLQEVINIVNKAKIDPDFSSDTNKWFVVENSDGLVDYSIILKLNEFSHVWKIESL